ncbi:MAG: ParB/Srx family N-terminal domain-containing protein [Tissierellales bacterium]|jgi:ParB family chromosome partitioning protein|nr:ParB/Srx family N-terminal domain-containing protein [Tissierellales bacterium]
MSKNNESIDKGANTLLDNIVGAYNDSLEVEEEELYKSLEVATNVRIIPLDKLVEAPKDWNFYSPITDEKFIGMKESMIKFGLFHPILVWENPDGKDFMILSGHNRTRAFRELLEEGHTEFRGIEAKIFRTEKIDKKSAEVAISYANQAQRNSTTKESFKALKKIYLDNQESEDVESKKENYKKMEAQTGKTTTTIRRILNLDKLIPEIFDMVGEELNYKHVQGITGKDKETQQWIFENFKEQLTNDTAKKIKKFTEKEQIEKIFDPVEEINESEKYLSVNIPPIIKSEVKKLIKEWEKANGIKWTY